ncbi:hypothetical protein [Salinibacter ruber]|uniref:hypothetical protein n=1 Tax=Salinibacter ruber TaxID=146919 RepID=UPI002168D45C|nr:hypothetical protein [Salinibacter ruber]MCS4051267.1 hypothetical protein [Salinibacter ruber]
MQSLRVDGSYNTAERHAPTTGAMDKVKDAQSEATEGFLTEEDVEKALELYKEYSQLHESCTVYVAPTCAEEEMTTLKLNGATHALRQSVEHDHGKRKTGFYIDFDFRKSDDEKLYERLVEEGFSRSHKRKYLDLEASTNEQPVYAALGRAKAKMEEASYVNEDKTYDQATIMKRAHALASALEAESYSEALSEAMSAVWEVAKRQMKPARRRTRVDCNYVAEIKGTHETYDLDRRFRDEKDWGYELEEGKAYEIDRDGERTYLVAGEEVSYEEAKDYAEELEETQETKSCWECGREYTRREVRSRRDGKWTTNVGDSCYCGC